MTIYLTGYRIAPTPLPGSCGVGRAEQLFGRLSVVHEPNLPEIYGVGRSERADYGFILYHESKRSRARPLPQVSGHKNY